MPAVGILEEFNVIVLYTVAKLYRDLIPAGDVDLHRHLTHR